MTLTEQQKQLFEWVKQHHGDQKRKYTLQPYWTHLWNVAEILDQNCINKRNLIEIAFCHDLLEDTNCGKENENEIYNYLYYDLKYPMTDALLIQSSVIELTDQFTKEKYPEHNRKQRKALESYRLGGITEMSQNVKYADLIDNTSSIVQYDPGFAVVYLEEKREILNYMRKGNIDLLIFCCHILCNAVAKLRKENKV